MSLSVISIGDNPQVPGVLAETYIPDQLIAGNMKLVTDGAVTITGGAALKRGAVLGQVGLGISGPATFVGTGNGTLTAISAGSMEKAGNYVVKMKSATTFDVINPSGVQLAEGLALGAYTDAEINFTITAGGTAFVAGDTFTIPVAAGSGAYKLAASAATDGSQTPVAVLVDDADASGGDVQGAVYLQGEFNGNALILGTGITLAAAKTAFRRLGLFVKASLSAADPT